MGANDLRVTIESPRLRCVLDPVLALGSPDAPRLALALGRVFETWLPRAFWRLLDSSEWLEPAGAPHGRGFADARAVAIWQALRERTDAASWQGLRLRWVGDNVAESQLALPAALSAEAALAGGGEGGDALIERFETLAESFEQRLRRRSAPVLALRTASGLAQPDEAGPGAPDDDLEHDDIAAAQPADAQAGTAPWCQGLDVESARTDAMALAAALDGALWLVPLREDDACSPLALLRRAGLAPHRVPALDRDSLAAAERDWVRQQLAAAGLAGALQAIGPLGVFHLVDDTGGRPGTPWWYELAGGA